MKRFYKGSPEGLLLSPDETLEKVMEIIAYEETENREVWDKLDNTTKTLFIGYNLYAIGYNEGSTDTLNTLTNIHKL